MAEVVTEQKGQLAGAAALQKIRELLKSFRSAMLVTASVGADPHARPMGLHGRAEEFDGTLWFFADDRSQKLRDLALNRRASLVFQNDLDSAYLYLSGDATQTKDRARMKALYTPLLNTWFPGGLEDPHLTLIRFDADGGHFWETAGGLLHVLGAFTRSMVTGTPARGIDDGSLEVRTARS